MTLTDLIAALERADGPSRELDAEIAFAVGWRMAHGHWWTPEQAAAARKSRRGLFSTGMPFAADPPFFTASTDAALTAVLAGWCIILYSETNTAELYQVNGVRRPSGIKARSSDCRNLPIAICIAALKARS